MKTKFVILTLIVAITVVFLSFAQYSFAQQSKALSEMKQKAQQQDYYKFRGMANKHLGKSSNAKVKEFIESLNLSEEQKNKIRKLDIDFQKEMLELKNKAEINRLEVKSLLLEEDPDLIKIRAKLQEIADLETEIKMKVIEEYLAVKGILTPEQQEKLPEGIPFQIFAFRKFIGAAKILGNYLW